MSVWVDDLDILPWRLNVQWHPMNETKKARHMIDELPNKTDEPKIAENSSGAKSHLAGFGTMRRLFSPKPEVRDNGQETPEEQQKRIMAQRMMDPLDLPAQFYRQQLEKQQQDRFALILMAAGLFLLFVGLWAWLGFGVGLPTLGLGVFGVGVYTTIDNHRAPKQYSPTIEKK